RNVTGVQTCALPISGAEVFDAALLQELGEILDRELVQERRQGGDEGCLDARLGGQCERDFEVLVRPAEAVLAPLLERPVRTASELDGRSERVRVDSECPAEAEGLDVGPEAGP